VSLGTTRGTGLGLAIVSDIVESYNGRLTLGDAGPGLTVTVLLPPPVAH
jgi:signal transduction histidine kinase